MAVQPPTLGVTHCKEELQRLVNSELLSHSPALVRLLNYLAERAILGEGETLKEYTIGVEALGKTEGYDTQADPSVRSQVRRLRAKLAEYYEGEGIENPARITLPKGTFVLHFEPRQVPLAEWAADAADRLQHWRRLALVLAVAVCVLAAGQIWYFVQEDDAAAASTSAALLTDDIRQIWGPHLDEDRPGIVSLGIPVFFRLHREAGSPGNLTDLIIRDTQFRSATGEETVERVEGWREIIGADSVTHWENYMAVGEALGAYRLGKILVAAGLDVPIVRSTALSWDEIRVNDVIFLGASKTNPHLQVEDLARHFRVTDGGVVNVTPAEGEAANYRNEDGANGARRGFAVFGRYPAPVGDGYATVVGSNMNLATWAAVEYLTRPHYASELVDGLEAQFGQVPEYFEVVIEARFHEQTPIAIHWVAMRDIAVDRPGASTD